MNDHVVVEFLRQDSQAHGRYFGRSVVDKGLQHGFFARRPKR